MENKRVIKPNQDLEVVDTITKSILELDETQLAYFLAIVQFHQRVNKLLFSEEDYKKFDEEADKAVSDLLKIKKEIRTNDDLVRAKKAIGKAIEKYGSIKGKPIIMEIAIKLSKHFSVKDVSEWVFSINDLYNNTYEMYDWMF